MVSKVKVQDSKVKSATKKVVKKPTVGVEATKISTKSTLSVPTFDAKGAKKGTTLLPKEVFGAEVNEDLMAQAVRVYLANQRQGNAKTQGRSDVTLTRSKWYRQKGTGRARHHSKSAPIFVGGGVAHGPKNRDFSLKFPKKMKNNSVISALSQKARDGEIKVITGFSKIDGKTKNMDTAIKKITDDKKGTSKSLLITASKPKELENVYRAGSNIKNLEIQNANLLNTYEILKYKNLLLMKESLDVLAEMRGSAKQKIKR